MTRTGTNKPREQQHESELVKRLEQPGIEVEVSPTGTTLTYEQIYTSGTTLEEALVTFLGEVLGLELRDCQRRRAAQRGNLTFNG